MTARPCGTPGASASEEKGMTTVDDEGRVERTAFSLGRRRQPLRPHQVGHGRARWRSRRCAARAGSASTTRWSPR